MLLANLILLMITSSFADIILDRTYEFDEKSLSHTFTSDEENIFEIHLGGGAGGDSGIKKGGKGGRIEARLTYKKGMKLFVVLGNFGEPEKKRPDCAGAGGGGASLVYLAPSPTSNTHKLLLAAGGGGGAGVETSAPNPDYNELNDFRSGKCDESGQKPMPGRSYPEDSNKGFNFTYNMNLEFNKSLSTNQGCLGGYGGGGEGGGGEATNTSTFGGGGGGGGFEGGQVDSTPFSCNAGGPGKPFCNPHSLKCGVPGSHDNAKGFFKIIIHEFYKELPETDRTNKERPGINQNTLGANNVEQLSLYSLLTLSVLVLMI